MLTQDPKAQTLSVTAMPNSAIRSTVMRAISSDMMVVGVGTDKAVN